MKAEVKSLKIQLKQKTRCGKAQERKIPD